MGSLKIIEGKNLLVSNGSTPSIDGIYISQKTLYNGKRWYKKDNPDPMVDFAIIYQVGPNPVDNYWELIILFNGFGIYHSNTNADNPWEPVWSDNLNVSATVLTDNKISIKKQNLGGGRLLAPKLNQRIIPRFLINVNGVFTGEFYDAGNSATVLATLTFIRFFTDSTTSGLNTTVDASGNYVQGFGPTFIDLYYPSSGTYTITLTQPGDAFYKPATPLTITITVLPPPGGSGSSGEGIGGGGV